MASAYEFPFFYIFTGNRESHVAVTEQKKGCVSASMGYILFTKTMFHILKDLSKVDVSQYQLNNTIITYLITV